MMERVGIKCRVGGEHGDTTQSSWRLVVTCAVQYEVAHGYGRITKNIRDMKEAIEGNILILIIDLSRSGFFI